MKRGRPSLVAVVAGATVAATGCGDDASRAVTISVRVPDGTPTVYLTGDAAPLGPWDPSGLAMEGDGPVRTATVEVPAGEPLEYKFTLGSWDREGLGPSGTVLPNFVVGPDETGAEQELFGWRKDPREIMADPQGSGVLGTLVYWSDVASNHLGPTRHVGIWLPPGYDADPERRYPVVYMSDGQNLFDPRLASGGVDWGVDEAVVAGVEAGLIEPAVVVGVFNTERRAEEYSPWHQAPAYARFLIEELMPRVESEFRVRTGPESTFVMGSSMGGLLSWHLVMKHPDRFGACGCVSTHFVLSEESAVRFLGGEGGDPTPFVIRDIERGITAPRDRRFFFDYGTEGLDSLYAPPHEAVRGWLLGQGLVEGEDFRIREYPGADHDEASWRARLGDQLEWLLGVG